MTPLSEFQLKACRSVVTERSMRLRGRSPWITEMDLAEAAYAAGLAAKQEEVDRLKKATELDFEIFHGLRMKLVAAGFNEYGGIEGMLNEAIIKATGAPVHVCPEKDIVCGNNPSNWCDSCPLIPKIDVERVIPAGGAETQLKLAINSTLGRLNNDDDYEQCIEEIVTLARQHFQAQATQEPDAWRIDLPDSQWFTDNLDEAVDDLTNVDGAVAVPLFERPDRADIISDLRHSTKVDHYTPGQIAFLQSIADRLSAAPTPPAAPTGHTKGCSE